MRFVYIVLCFLGTILPMSALGPWLVENGGDILAFTGGMIETPSARYLSYDLLVTWIALITFIVVEGRRLQMKMLWVPILGGTIVGASLGLPLFFLMRENHFLTHEPLHGGGPEFGSRIWTDLRP